MIESRPDSPDPFIEWIAREARRPVASAPGARARVMEAVRGTPLPARPRRARRWLTSARPVALSPLTGSLLAAGLVGIGIIAGLSFTHRDGRLPTEQPAAVAARPQLPVPDTVLVHEFVLEAPGARHVSLVGDFNRWSETATPMKQQDNGRWVVTLKLPRGLHFYAFVVDSANGSATWTPDPSALRAPDNGLGSNSMVLIGQGSST